MAYSKSDLNKKVSTAKQAAEEANSALISQQKTLADIFNLESKITQQRFDQIDNLEKEIKQLSAKAAAQSKYYNKILKKQKEYNTEIDKSLSDYGDIEESLTSIGNRIGKNDDLYKANVRRVERIQKTTVGIGTIIKGNNDLTKQQEKTIIAATKAYHNTQSSIQKAGLSLKESKITQQQYNDLIIKSQKELNDVVKGIDATTKSGEGALEIFKQMDKEMSGIVASAKISKAALGGISNISSGIGATGIPLSGELEGVGKALVTGGIVAAVGALALGAVKLAYNLGLVGDKLSTTAKYDQKLIAISEKIEEINDRIALGELGGGQNFVALKAAQSFMTSMEQGAAAFQSASKTALFGKGIGSMNYGAGQMQQAGISADQVAEAMKAAGDASGKMSTSQNASDMALLAKFSGASATSLATINEAMTRSQGISSSVAANLQAGFSKMAEAAGVNLTSATEELASASKNMYSYNIKNTSALAKQVVYAKSMGVSFSEIASAGKNMVLNYKDSIKSEMQLSAMLGKDVDLSEVRQKFAEGDTQGALKALKDSGLDPGEMDMFQKDMLQKATGMDLDSLSKIAKNKGVEVGDLKATDLKTDNQKLLDQNISAAASLATISANIAAQGSILQNSLTAQESIAKKQGIIDNVAGLKDITKDKLLVEMQKENGWAGELWDDIKEGMQMATGTITAEQAAKMQEAFANRNTKFNPLPDIGGGKPAAGAAVSTLTGATFGTGVVATTHTKPQPSGVGTITTNGAGTQKVDTVPPAVVHKRAETQLEVLQDIKSNTLAMLNLTKQLEALAELSYVGASGGQYVLQLDGKDISKSVSNYKSATKALQ